MARVRRDASAVTTVTGCDGPRSPRRIGRHDG
jgi:hypothetical protein